ncbi:Hypothetical protein I596_2376 [Dokdonella koreensis DS-123]|uniref:Uncharacterized protein n=1 Tax=Dokdonella koreensis DS-123 TaxID=1300342 RepID=A0A160DVJ9_9GAMM|nr:Hypothetical protein I596_2376 [Dokdonella koreensis DS-123]
MGSQRFHVVDSAVVGRNRSPRRAGAGFGYLAAASPVGADASLGGRRRPGGSSR